MSAAPLVSVIVVVRNGGRYLAAALESIAAQDCHPREVFVVDGASTDRTVAIARSMPGVRVLAQDGLGLAAARNQGLAAARGEFVAFLDHDDLWTQGKLTQQIARLRAHPELQYVLAHVRLFAEAGELAKTREQTGCTPGALVARRTLFAELGGFRPEFEIGCDAEWFARARDRGVPMAVLPAVLLHKRLHPTNLSRHGTRHARELLVILHESLQRKRGG